MICKSEEDGKLSQPLYSTAGWWATDGFTTKEARVSGHAHDRARGRRGVAANSLGDMPTFVALWLDSRCSRVKALASRLQT